jgi:microcompartment protein CcmK/EutM
MRIAEVIGTVTLNRIHPSFRGARLKLVVPLSLDDLAGKTQPAADPLVSWDELGAGLGNRVAISEGGEAAQPFHPAYKPVDTYTAAILDQLEIDVSM